MIDYKKGKIYKLVSGQTNLVYYGSTCQPLCNRKASHVRSYKWYQKSKKQYRTSYDIIKYDDCDIILVEDYPCENKQQLHARERYYIENNDCVNICIPTRTAKEYYEGHKKQIAEYKANYRVKNLDKIKTKAKMYRINNREKIVEKNKLYYQSHKEEHAIKGKAWREANKEKLAAEEKIKMTCGCGTTFNKRKKARHEKSNKHQNYLKALKKKANYEAKKQRNKEKAKAIEH